MSTKQVEVRTIPEWELRGLKSISMTVRDQREADAPETHEAYCFVPVDSLPPVHSPRSLLNQLSSAFNSDYVHLDIIEAGFDNRPSIRITYLEDGPDPEDDDSEE